jgi:hypothetical protein
MRKNFIIAIFILLAGQNCFCQDFVFSWRVWPFSYNSYSVRIIKNGSKKIIVIKDSWSNDSTVKKLKKVDCDSLVNFLNNYNFRHKGSSISHPYKEYFNTVFLHDSNWVVLNNDTIRKSSIRPMGYYFDPDSNRYYEERWWGISWTDGNTYEGEYITDSFSKHFKVYCARIEPNEYKLNLIILELILKYNKRNDYSILKNIIVSDKPGKIIY